MVSNINKLRINTKMQSSSVPSRQKAQAESLRLYAQTAYLLDSSHKCTPNNPCNTSQCSSCGNRYAKNKSEEIRDKELRIRPRSKANADHGEHPTIDTSALASRNKNASIAARQDAIAFDQQYGRLGILPFSLNCAVIPFDHRDPEFNLGNHKLDEHCLSAEVRNAIAEWKPELQKLFYGFLDDAPWMARFECAIIELKDHPQWVAEENKWAEVRSRCKYGILVHIHGIFAGLTKAVFKKACSKKGYTIRFQTCIEKLTKQSKKGRYTKGGLSGWAEYWEKNGFLGKFGTDNCALYPIHAHIRKQVGRQLIKVSHRSYKPYPLVRTWECLNPQDVYDEMRQDYLEQWIHPHQLYDYSDDWGLNPSDHDSYSEMRLDYLRSTDEMLFSAPDAYDHETFRLYHPLGTKLVSWFKDMASRFEQHVQFLTTLLPLHYIDSLKTTSQRIKASEPIFGGPQHFSGWFPTIRSDGLKFHKRE